MLKNKRKKKYTKYARTFCDRVRNDFEILQRMQVRYPKMKFYTKKGLTKDIDFSYCDPFKKGDYTEISGFYDTEKDCIEIYNFTREKPEELKKTIRHECLHFILASCGLPYSDNDELFITLAIIYNARPYALLKPENKYILDKIERAKE